MNTNIRFVNYECGKGTKSYIESRIEKFEKFFLEDTNVSVNVSGTRDFITIEITVSLKNNFLRVEVVDKDINAAIDMAIDKLDLRLKKYKDRIKESLNDSIRHEMIEEDKALEENLKIVKSKKFAIKPMLEEEASLQMDLLGHMFYVFLNAKTEEVNVIYKRKDGNYGLIEPEF